MGAAIRFLAFLIAGAGLEIARGPGAVVLVVAALLGAMRGTPLLVIAVAVAGAFVSLELPDAASAGKVSHSLSNAPFVVLLYVALAVLATAGGRLGRVVLRTLPRPTK